MSTYEVVDGAMEQIRAGGKLVWTAAAVVAGEEALGKFEANG